MVQEVTLATLTLELPDTLARQLREHQIAEKEAKAVALAALEIWLAYLNDKPAREEKAGGRFAGSAVPFVRRLIAQNRELFEALAR